MQNKSSSLCVKLKATKSELYNLSNAQSATKTAFSFCVNCGRVSSGNAISMFCFSLRIKRKSIFVCFLRLQIKPNESRAFLMSLSSLSSNVLNRSITLQLSLDKR